MEYAFFKNIFLKDLLLSIWDIRQNSLMPNITPLQVLLNAEILVELKSIWKKFRILCGLQWFGVSSHYIPILSLMDV